MYIYIYEYLKYIRLLIILNNLIQLYAYCYLVFIRIYNIYINIYNLKNIENKI